ncbi:MAG: zinc ribbon domain-containing protein [archaeon]
MQRICQSCGMPMEKSSDFGTNNDGSRNFEYCNFCFQQGKFTQPDLKREEMIARVAKMTPGMLSKEKAKTLISKLKRWT